MSAINERAIPPGLGRGKAAAIEKAWALFDQCASAFGKDHPVTHAADAAVSQLYFHAEGELLRERTAAMRAAEDVANAA